MTRHLASLAIASGLTFGGIVWAQDPGARPGSPNDPAIQVRPGADASINAGARAQFPNGITPKQLNDQEDVRSVLAAATNAAFTKGGFDDMVERFTAADRNRIGDFAKQDFTELDGRIDQIRQAWEQKYGQSFNLDNQQLFAGFVQIQEGEISDTTALAGQWPVKAWSKDGYRGDHLGSQTDINRDRGMGTPADINRDRDPMRPADPNRPNIDTTPGARPDPTAPGTDPTGREPRTGIQGGTGAGGSAGVGGAGVSGSVGADPSGAGVSGSANVGGTGISGSANVNDPTRPSGGIAGSGTGAPRTGATDPQTGIHGGTGAGGAAGVGERTDRVDPAIPAGTGRDLARDPNTTPGRDVNVAGRDLDDRRLGGDMSYLERGRNVALVTVPASHGMPGLHLSMIQEPVDDWRIDLPDKLSGQQIHDNLKTALTHVGENINSLPADVNEAYRHVAHTVLMAMHGVPIDAAKQTPTAGADTGETGR